MDPKTWRERRAQSQPQGLFDAERGIFEDLERRLAEGRKIAEMANLSWRERHDLFFSPSRQERIDSGFKALGQPGPDLAGMPPVLTLPPEFTDEAKARAEKERAQAAEASREMARRLIEAGSGPNAPFAREPSVAVRMAVSNGDFERLRSLLDAGADPQLAAPDREGLVPAHAAAQGGSIVERLAALGIDPQLLARDTEGQAQAHLDARSQVPSIARLVELGVDPKRSAPGGDGPIQADVDARRPEPSIEEAIKSGALQRNLAKLDEFAARMAAERSGKHPPEPSPAAPASKLDCLKLLVGADKGVDPERLALDEREFDARLRERCEFASRALEARLAALAPIREAAFGGRDPSAGSPRHRS